MSGLVVQETRLGFAVFNAEGHRVSPVFVDSDAALDVAQRRKRALGKRKTCPCCGYTFNSTGRQNHMCVDCASRNSG